MSRLKNPSTIYNQNQLNCHLGKSFSEIDLHNFEIPPVIPDCLCLCLVDMDFGNKDFVVPDFVESLFLNRPRNLKRLITNKITHLWFWNCESTFEANFSSITHVCFMSCFKIKLNEKEILSSSLTKFINDRSEIEMTPKTKEFLEICSDEVKRKEFLMAIKQRKTVSHFRLLLEKNLKENNRENCARNRMELLLT